MGGKSQLPATQAQLWRPSPETWNMHDDSLGP